MPPDADIVLAKTATIDRCLQRIRSRIDENGVLQTDVDSIDIVDLNLQRAAQTCIDLAHHLCAAAELGPVLTQKQAFSELQKHDNLPEALAERLQRMVGFRNIAVHDYDTLDRDLIAEVVRCHLSDLEAFSAFAVRHIVGHRP